MMNSPLLDKSKAFALRVIKVCNVIKREKKEMILTNQLVRSGTSIGANVAEAQRGQSKADFTAKMNIALKEANETLYWLKLLYRTDFLTQSQFENLEKDIQELLGILIAICRTSGIKK